MASDLFGVDEEEIHHCLLLYWRLVLATWRFEKAFLREYFEVGYPVHTTLQPLPFAPHLEIQYLGPSTVEIEGLFLFDTPIIDYSSARDNPYIERRDFRRHHGDYVGDDSLTLDGCWGISTRLVPKALEPEHQLLYIAEYSTASEPCQDAEDCRVSQYTTLGGEYVHRPAFHPLFYQYLCRSLWTHISRIKNATFFNSSSTWEEHRADIEHIKQEHALISLKSDCRPQR